MKAAAASSTRDSAAAVMHGGSSPQKSFRRRDGGPSFMKSPKLPLVGFLVVCSLFWAWTQEPEEPRHYQQQSRLSLADEVAKVAVAAAAAEAKVARTYEATPIGHLGPKGTTRESLTYYDTLFYLAMQYGGGKGGNVRSVLEVGCADDPFVKYLSWIDDITCVAPYFVKYAGRSDEKEDAGASLTSTGETDPSATTTQRYGEVKLVEADFMEYNGISSGKEYDLVVCSQVVEHVPDPAAFMKKLIETAKVAAIISVPYMWTNCNPKCHHLSNHISIDTVLEWSHPYKPKQISIVSDPSPNKAYDPKRKKSQNEDRIVLVFTKQ